MMTGLGFRMQKMTMHTAAESTLITESVPQTEVPAEVEFEVARDALAQIVVACFSRRMPGWFPPFRNAMDPPPSSSPTPSSH
jgi:hypothetical protein